LYKVVDVHPDSLFPRSQSHRKCWLAICERSGIRDGKQNHCNDTFENEKYVSVPSVMQSARASENFFTFFRSIMMTDVTKNKKCLGCGTCPFESMCQAEIEPGQRNWFADIKTFEQMVWELEHSQPLVEYRDGEFIFHDEHGPRYAFEAERADTNAKLLEWIRHMTEKVWVTGPHINPTFAVRG
jgi:hypothetical protein